MAVAMTYGLVNQSVGYLFKILEKICHVDGLKKAEVTVIPDYTLKGMAFDCNLTFRVSIKNVGKNLGSSGHLNGTVNIFLSYPEVIAVDSGLVFQQKMSVPLIPHCRPACRDVGQNA